MLHGFSKLPFDQFFTYSSCYATRGHSQKLAKRHSNTDIKLFPFSARFITRKTSLPQDVVYSVNLFKGRLERLRSSRMAFSWTNGLLKPYWLHYVFDMYIYIRLLEYDKLHIHSI